MPAQAIVLAAGRGSRLRPWTDRLPKPLVPVAGRALIDWQLASLAAQGVRRVVINSCYLADMLEAHLRSHAYPLEIHISRESRLLETGGGILKAMALLEPGPFFALNADMIVWPPDQAPLARLVAKLRAHAQAKLGLLLYPRERALGIRAPGDFHCREGALTRRGRERTAPYLFSGIQWLDPKVFDGSEPEAFSMNRIYDRLLQMQPALLRGVIQENGMLLHVGDPEGKEACEDYLAQQPHVAT